MKIAIIGGAGKMGRWLAGWLLKEGRQVVITGRNEDKLREAGHELGVDITTDNTAAISGAAYVLLSVPIDDFEEIVRHLSPHVGPEQVVIDITSTKEMPVAVMHRYLPDNLVLGAHPLFGPGARSLENQNFVLTPTNEREAALAGKIKEYLETRRARVILMTPREHDETMSLVLGLSHYIAIVAADTLLGSGRFKPVGAAGSSTYKVLLTLIESVLSEDPGLYASIQMNLPKVAEFEELFRKKAEAWGDLVAGKNRREFARRMQALKTALEDIAPGFEKAYGNMYRIVEGLSAGEGETESGDINTRQ